MGRKLFFKLFGIGFLASILLVPLGMVETRINERLFLHHQVKTEIADTAAGEQTLVGPVIVIHYAVRTPPETRKDPETGKIVTITRQDRVLTVPMRHLKVTGTGKVEERYRGIYQARLYHLDLDISGEASLPDLKRYGDIMEARAQLLLGVSDLRGIDNDPEIVINGDVHHFFADSQVWDDIPGKRLAVDLGRLPLDAPRQYAIAFPLKLTGTETFAFAPTAELNRVELKSDWPDPSFTGRFLPRARQIDKQGFVAQWEISHLARDFTAALQANDNSREVLAVDFIEPGNIYMKSLRAVKYGILFIVLTFAAFFLCEVLRRRSMHAMQYLLVGLALAIFFLLLIALSEHIAFLHAYLIAAVACIGLVALYLSGVLGRKSAIGFGAGLVGLYGVLFGVLESEDNALLMGSLLLFIALAAIMLGTRALDWHRLNRVEQGEHP
ncbi:MAG: cell envelope integrity protein CreD [Zoogloeaceae bacterium]|nr:cell envelope integrity protein CreD [Zoogloeaceae bacterium]